jgi:hypothetical protein
MKSIIKIFSLTVLFAGIVNISYAQRTRQLRGEGNTRASENVSRAPSAPRQMETRSAPVRSFNNNLGSSPRVQSNQPSRQMTVRQVPDRNFNNNRVAQTRNFQNSSNNQRVFSQRNSTSSDQRIVASRNNDNRYDRDRVSRNVYQNNYRGYDRDNRYYNHYDRDDRYYGNVYGRRTRFMFGTRYTVIPHNFISIHFGGYPYYYYGGYYYGYYDGFYTPIFPPFGLHISVLPFGYIRLFIGGIPYYYYNGIYYRQYDNSYQVVDAPMGATVSSLPDGARSVIINGEKLYELNGTYYKADRDENGNDVFIVVGKNGVINNTPIDESNIINSPESMQIGDIVTQLPENSKIITVNGEQLYETPDNVYLREETNNGIVQYKVVGK